MAVVDQESDNASDSDLSEEDAPVLWVLKTTLDQVTKATENKEDVSKEKIDMLIDPDEIADEAVLVPLDLNDAAIEDLDDLVEQRGPNVVAEMLVEARKRFLENINAMSAEDRDTVPQELTGAEYKELMLEEMGKAAAEDEEGEEEVDADAGDGEVEVDDEEPAAKKQKTDSS